MANLLIYIEFPTAPWLSWKQV